MKNGMVISLATIGSIGLKYGTPLFWAKKSTLMWSIWHKVVAVNKYDKAVLH